MVTAPVVEATDPNGPDIKKAYDAISNGRLDDAVRLASAIRKRDPKYLGLAPLQLAIDNQRAFDVKQKEAADAAASAALAAANAPPPAPAKPLADPVEPTPSTPAPAATVLPGGSFVATSEPISPLTAGQAARPEIEAAVQEWARALGTRDIATISRVRSLSRQQADNWVRIFQPLRAFRMNVKLIGDPIVTDDIAVVRVQEHRVQTDRKGIEFEMRPQEVDYRLRKSGSQWKLLPPP